MARGVRVQLSLQFIGILTVLRSLTSPRSHSPRGFIKLIKVLLAPVVNIMKPAVR